MNYLSALDFWGDEENPYAELLQALFENSGSAQPGAVDSQSGADAGGPFPMGTQFGSQSSGPTGHIPQWLTNPELPPGTSYGSMGGLRTAENAGLIGRGVGALTGLPGMGALGRALGDRYIGSNVFMSPVSNQGSFANAIDTMLYGDRPRQSSAIIDELEKKSVK